MSIRTAKPEELQKLIILVSEAFHYGEGERADRDFPLLYSPKNIDNLYVFEEHNELLAHAGFFIAKMKLEGAELPVAGIGGVCTLPKAQGQGHASELVEECLKQAKAKGAALAFLWTDKHDFYRKLGFELVGRQWCIEMARNALEKLAGHFENQQIGLTLSTDTKGKFLEQSLRLLSSQALGIIRSSEEHEALLDSHSCKVYSAWRGSELKAYLAVGKGKDLSGYIHEWAGSETELLWLLSESVKISGAKFLLSPQFMRNEESWIYALEELGFPMTAQYMGMVKILDLKPVLKVLAGFLTTIGLKPGDLSIREEKGAYEISWQNSWKETQTEAGLLRFLFGPDPPSQKELSGVLPMRVWYWGMDSI